MSRAGGHAEIKDTLRGVCGCMRTRIYEQKKHVVNTWKWDIIDDIGTGTRAVTRQAYLSLLSAIQCLTDPILLTPSQS
jgi:hypothetical protein